MPAGLKSIKQYFKRLFDECLFKGFKVNSESVIACLSQFYKIERESGVMD